MKRLSHLFFILFASSACYGQVSSRLIASQATPLDSAVLNVMFVDTAAGAMNRTWVARTSSLKFRTRQIRGLKDSVTLFTAPLYRPMSYVPSWSQITSKPTFSSVATTGSYNDLSGKPTIPVIPSGVSAFLNDAGYLVSVPAQSFSSLTAKPTTLLGYGITDAYPLTTNPSGFLTSVPAQTWSSLLGKPSFANVATSGLYSDLTGTPTIVNYTAGGGINISAGVISSTAVAATFNPNPARAVNTNYTISTTRNARVSYTVAITTALSLLNLNSAARAFLEYSTNAGSSWNIINSAGTSRVLSVSLSVGLNETSYVNLVGEIPSNALVRIRTVVSGGGVVSWDSGIEVLQ